MTLSLNLLTQTCTTQDWAFSSQAVKLSISNTKNQSGSRSTWTSFSRDRLSSNNLFQIPQRVKLEHFLAQESFKANQWSKTKEVLQDSQRIPRSQLKLMKLQSLSQSKSTIFLMTKLCQSMTVTSWWAPLKTIFSRELERLGWKFQPLKPHLQLRIEELPIYYRLKNSLSNNRLRLIRE